MTSGVSGYKEADQDRGEPSKASQGAGRFVTGCRETPLFPVADDSTAFIRETCLSPADSLSKGRMPKRLSMNAMIRKINELTNVSITIDQDIVVTRNLTPPEGEVSFVDILPEIYTLHAAIIDATLDQNRNNGIHVTCGKGCDACCHHLITVSIHEALLLAHLVENLNPPKREAIKKRFDHILLILEQQHILKDLLHYHINEFDNKEAIIDIQKRYWSLNLRCPFLIEKACCIYPYRPLICREYLVSSDPVCCQESFRNDHLVHKIALTHGFASAAASFDGAEAIMTRGIPLPTVFLINGLLTYFPRPKASAEQMLARYFRHVDTHFRNQAALKGS